jgi:hypothetical protein
MMSDLLLAILMSSLAPWQIIWWKGSEHRNNHYMPHTNCLLHRLPPCLLQEIEKYFSVGQHKWKHTAETGVT